MQAELSTYVAPTSMMPTSWSVIVTAVTFTLVLLPQHRNLHLSFIPVADRNGNFGGCDVDVDRNYHLLFVCPTVSRHVSQELSIRLRRIIRGIIMPDKKSGLFWQTVFIKQVERNRAYQNALFRFFSDEQSNTPLPMRPAFFVENC